MGRRSTSALVVLPVPAGADRHRVLWRAGAAAGDPVLGDACPVCDAPLPAEPVTAA
jgi:hypothetical protein